MRNVKKLNRGDVSMNITHHGKKRIKQRFNISKKAVNSLVKKALKTGITHSETKGSLNRYFTSLYFKNQTANNIRIYNYKVFIFSGTTLITVFDAPTKYKKTIEILAKNKKIVACGLEE